MSVENNANNTLASTIGWKPDLILLDVVMEDVDGIKVLQKLKANETTKDIPVIMLTNTSDKKNIDEAKSAGAIDYWEKTKLIPSDIVKKSKKILSII